MIIAAGIITIVEKEITRQKLDGVSTIKLRIGALAEINPEAWRLGFKAASADSLMERTTVGSYWAIVKANAEPAEKTPVREDKNPQKYHLLPAYFSVTHPLNQWL